MNLSSEALRVRPEPYSSQASGQWRHQQGKIHLAVLAFSVLTVTLGLIVFAFYFTEGLVECDLRYPYCLVRLSRDISPELWGKTYLRAGRGKISFDLPRISASRKWLSLDATLVSECPVCQRRWDWEVTVEMDLENGRPVPGRDRRFCRVGGIGLQEYDLVAERSKIGPLVAALNVLLRFK